MIKFYIALGGVLLVTAGILALLQIPNWQILLIGAGVLQIASVWHKS